MSGLREKKKWLALGMVAVLVVGLVIFSSNRSGSELKKMMKADVVYTFYDSGPIAAAFVTSKGDMVQVASDGSKITYLTPAGEWVVVYLDERGLPIKMVGSNGTIIQLANYTETTVDVAVVDPAGKVTTKRKVPLNTPLQPEQLSVATTSHLLDQVEQLSLKGVAKGSPDFSNELSLIDDLGDGRISGSDAVDLVLFSAGIGLSVGAIIVGSPVVAVVAAVGIGVSIAKAFSDNDALGVSSTLFNSYSCATTPLDPSGAVSCASLGKTVWDGWEESVASIEARQSAGANLARSALIFGTGDVQATLTWNNTSDVDLWVVDPNGEAIGFKNKRARSGGRLDVDDRNGHGPENIFWPSGKAPKGQYKVVVHHYKSRGTPHYKVLVRVNGKERNFEGSLRSNERKELWSFVVGPEIY